MNKIFSVGLLIALFIVNTVLSQDIHFSQLPMAPLNLNPALAGANYSNQASLVYRDQWKSSDAQFTTIYAGYDQRFLENNKNGFLVGGINFFSDKAGDSQMKTNYVGVTMGYHVRLDQKQLLGLCVQPSFGQRSIDYAALRWGMQYNGNGFDSNLPTGESGTLANQFSYFDIGAGMVYTYKSSEHYMTSNDHLLINAGYSVNHINRPRYTFFNSENENLFMRHTLFVNAQIGLKNSKISLMPGFYSMLQGSHTEFLLGTYFRYSLQDKSHYTGIKKGSAISLGGFYRLGDAIAVKAMLDWAQFSFGFSYDINLSNYTTATQGRGGFELAIRFVSPNPFSHNSRSSF
ncbi:MAG: PorP/SprF family type IX secretion system membrane protein [Bacteroidota bacterium]|jgi:type IX secretion system PorP/SprF family membrane protein